MQTDWRLNKFTVFVLDLFNVISVWINLGNILDHLILLKCDANMKAAPATFLNVFMNIIYIYIYIYMHVYVYVYVYI